VSKIISNLVWHDLTTGYHADQCLLMVIS